MNEAAGRNNGVGAVAPAVGTRCVAAAVAVAAGVGTGGFSAGWPMSKSPGKG